MNYDSNQDPFCALNRHIFRKCTASLECPSNSSLFFLFQNKKLLQGPSIHISRLLGDKLIMIQVDLCTTVLHTPQENCKNNIKSSNSHFKTIPSGLINSMMVLIIEYEICIAFPYQTIIRGNISETMLRSKSIY